jgi:hypothetical protein
VITPPIGFVLGLIVIIGLAAFVVNRLSRR